MLSKLELRIPPPLVMLLFMVTVFGFDKIMPFTLFYLPWLTYALVISLVTLGGVIALWGVKEFRDAKTTVNPLKPESSSSLVSSGIYQYTRNPMYLGFLLILLSSVVYTQHPLGLVSALGFVTYMNRFQIEPEEKILVKLFGDEFVDYMNQVKRWF
ncbi:MULTISPECIES: methyltransferase family protein [Aliivibrio]|jgi:protein-S-isoprenylcysteine O-methyltransferase Ste14|uniref:Isoprenylcysteine carboxylmethyltransferase family protein n=1 Tax=Aliivibrio finisterrensis TaxID=511998 RepID=A0A4Q5KS77_9GAMM|nr:MULTISPECIES: isoprenylcysteine carboxylmethyltransferase family protein [Aliivibrio]MDD9180373.1 isoprenylcysteine carboxylmethyltransferase family protein [Aliivibrio sp. A6]RYU48988.1 isoprenylcysteine carboxylmethyltransferase family protein [Aliivibrio finisterrensis]RYU49268.1 isoprenylcysteine carboxylmethyltransferase family protein [Aliivibrio finisterrensis]RYU54559.1 isoprenylcysteine carboxylmethyltransferase family protein [Aliivibrio finisterrensis]RYU61218.1 isoprenylcysteine